MIRAFPVLARCMLCIIHYVLHIIWVIPRDIGRITAFRLCIVRVGTAQSAVGYRAPLAGIASRMKMDISRPTVPESGQCPYALL